MGWGGVVQPVGLSLQLQGFGEEGGSGKPAQRLCWCGSVKVAYCVVGGARVMPPSPTSPQPTTQWATFTGGEAYNMVGSIHHGASVCAGCFHDLASLSRQEPM